MQGGTEATEARAKGVAGREEEKGRGKENAGDGTRRVECEVEDGEWIGEVYTVSNVEEEEDHEGDKGVGDHLLTEDVTRRFIAELGGNGCASILFRDTTTGYIGVENMFDATVVSSFAIGLPNAGFLPLAVI